MKNELIVKARKMEILAQEILKMLSSLESECVEECKKLPVGKLHAAKRGKQVAYYKRIKSDDKTGEYIPRSKVEEAQKLAQREYDEELLKSINRYKYHLRFIASIEESLFAKNLNKTKMAIINRKILTDEEYIEQWMNRFAEEEENQHPISTEYYTAKGEHVRSKSECLIADILNRMNVPYKYESKCEIMGYNQYHPDFTCLNVRTRKSIIWEHFGLMSDPSYAENTSKKIRQLVMSGYRFGIDFIFTMETAQDPLSTRVIEKMITDYLI